MGYQSTSGRYVRTRDLTLAASAARTATGTGSAIPTDGLRVLNAELTVSARSGTTPTLDVVIQTRKNSSDTWRTVGTFAQKTNTGTERISCMVDREVRESHTIGGTTPSFTFTVTAEGK